MGHGHELRYMGSSNVDPSESSQPALSALAGAVDDYLQTEVAGLGGRSAAAIHVRALELQQLLAEAASSWARRPLPAPLTCDECPFIALSQQLSDAGPARTGPGTPHATATDQPPAGRT